jgi:hypothetical protein
MRSQKASGDKGLSAKAHLTREVQKDIFHGRACGLSGMSALEDLG